MKKVVFGLTLLLMIIAMPKVKASAGFVSDEALGGMSKAIDDCIKNGGNPSECLPYSYRISDEEKEVLCRIVEAEVTGEGNEDYLIAKKNVASCVIARVESGWGKTITEVVFQKKQFSPISDGRYYTVTITEQTRKAVEWVLRYGKTHDAEYFCTRTCESYKSGYHSTLTKVFDDAVHAYFKEGD